LNGTRAISILNNIQKASGFKGETLLTENCSFISIIIPTFNRDSFLPNAIKGITQLKFRSDEFEILIIDNGSTDNTGNISNSIIRANPQYSIKYFFEHSPGLLAARHKGVSEASGNILTFVDDDIIPFPTWLEAISRSFEDEEIQLVGGKSLPKYETTPPTWLNHLWSDTPYGGISCGHLSLLDLGDQPRDIHPDYIWGLNLSIRKTALVDAGGFHPDLYPKVFQRFQGDGETGLTRSCYKRGFKAMYIPEAGVHHCIPPGRMTGSYFENRMFYQGVCDSYTNIRSKGKLGGETFRIKKIIKSLSYPFHCMKGLFSRVKKSQKWVTEPSGLKTVKQQMKRGYNNGYQFHQTEVKNDPQLLKWVLKENYWDYQIPTDDKKPRNVDMFEKSY
jgi:glycosyltransferase involved in cell wall biosynthesis